MCMFKICTSVFYEHIRKEMMNKLAVLSQLVQCSVKMRTLSVRTDKMVNQDQP